MQSLEIKKINLCQLNPKVGAITENLAKIISAISEAKTKKVDVILFPELCLTGYPPNDILFRKSYQSQIFNAIQRIQELAHDIVVLIGHPFFSNDKIYNSASVIAGGKVILRHDKIMLPNREVFDEKRYFFAGEDLKSFYIKNTKCALVICEDIWHEFVNLKIKKLKPELIFCINASPFQIGKLNQRIKIIKNACSIHSANYLYLNLVGGQDSLVFDGSSFAIDSSGKVVAQAKQFHEDKLEINFTSKKMVGAIAPNQHGELHQIYQALVLGIRDYILKNNIPGIILGLSGGIDSALALAICVDAIGADKIKCFSLPSEYTSDESKNLAKAQAKLQNVRLENLDINNIFHEILDITKISKNSLAAQNIQARIRGNLLMAIANENDYILVNTSNRSELATGYGTLYGDLAGGFAILKNIPKTLVFELAKWRNEKCKAIIDAIINRQPTAELAYKQKDTDDLPPYEILDPIISLYIDEQKSRLEIINQGYSKEQVNKIVKLINRSEFKRFQGPPGVELTPRSFGSARRYPITATIDE